MNAPLAATLICLCGQACAMPPAQGAHLTAMPPQAVVSHGPQAHAPQAHAPGATAALDTARPAGEDRSAQEPRSQRGPSAPAGGPPASRERGLLLAAFALMAGITLRRLGDGSP